MFCNNCGEEIGNEKICPNCGTSQNNEETIDDTITENYDNETSEEQTIEEETIEETTTHEVMSMENNDDTIFCSNCGNEITEDVSFCPSCGVNLESPEPKANSNNTTKFCQNCGSEIDENAMVCPKCGVGTKISNSNKNTAIAFILNLLIGPIAPGIGQIYLGLTTKGILMIAAYGISAILLGISIILIFALIGIPFVIIFGILLAAIYIYALVDAILSGQRIENGEDVEDSLFGISF